MEGREARRGFSVRDRRGNRQTQARGSLQLINLDGWGFIVRKDSETADTQLTFEQAYDEISRNVRKEVVKARHAAWIARMREEAFIKIYPIPDEQ